MSKRPIPEPVDQGDSSAPWNSRGAEAVQVAHRDPAASMLLLRNIEINALDPAYRDAAQNRHRKTRPGRKVVTVLLAVLLAFVTTVAAINLRNWNEGTPRPESQLAQQVHNVQERVADLVKTNADLTAQARAAEVLGGATTGIGPAIALAAASTRVTGPGVLITVNPDQSMPTTRTGQFRDSDLRSVNNLLWEAGAEALSINGNRLGPETSVRSAGSSILVNLVPVSPPYVIEAIGDPSGLWSAIQSGAGAQRIKEISRASGATVNAVRAENLVLGALPLPSAGNVETDTQPN